MSDSMRKMPRKSFTDDDLKLLKKLIEAPEITGEIISLDFWILNNLLTRLEAAEHLAYYANHETDCIRTFCEAGEPTEDGGYRTKFAGKWYQSRPINQEPKCNCGVDELDKAWRKAAGK